MNWFRFYHEALDDPKVQLLPPATFKNWVNVLCLASKSSPRGVVPAVKDVCFSLHVNEKRALAILNELAEHGLLDRVDGWYVPHNWSERQKPSDSSAERVKRYRERQDINTEDVTRNVTETLQEPLLKRSCNGIEKEEEKEKDTSPPNPLTGEAPDGAKPELTVMDGGKGKSRRSRPRYSADFETFWVAYPSGHGNKQRAFTEWRKLKPDAETIAKIMAGLDAWKQCRRWRDGFIKAAETWLKDAWWENEPPGVNVHPIRNSLNINDYAPDEWPSLAYGPANTPEERELSRLAAERLMG